MNPEIARPMKPEMSAAIVGIAWMLVSSVLLAAVAVMGRYVGLAGFVAFQVVFLRVMFAAVSLSPMLLKRRREMLRTKHLKLYVVRVVCGVTAMSLWFAALAYAPVGEVVAIGFLTPLLATAGAGIVLGEKIGPYRWFAAFVGFAGALVIIRPGYVAAGTGTWLALAAAVMMAVCALLIKALAERDDPDKVVLISTMMQTVLMAVPAAWVWQPPSLEMWLVFVGMGALGMLGHITLARSLRAADASVVVPVEFARLPFAVLLGFVLFDELIDVWATVGACMIFAATTFSAWRESRVSAVPADAG